MTSTEPYTPPKKLEPDLARALSFWEGLKRRQAEIPFWDDVNIPALPELSGRLLMIEATDKPIRFRFGFGVVGDDIKQRYGGDLAGKFLDEIEAREPLHLLVSQCSATVENRAPTYYRHHVPGRSSAKHGYSRLLMPLWGDGRIGMLLGAFAWE
jgi:hypothetical protein